MFYWVLELLWNWTQVDILFDYTNVANENCVKFVWNEFSSVEREEWCDEMKDEQNLKLGDAHVTPRYIQEVQASKLGDARSEERRVGKEC